MIAENDFRNARDRLWSDGNFIGALLILLVTLLSFAMSAAVWLLIRRGVIAPADLAAEDLGLGNTRFVLLQGALYVLSTGLPTVLGLILFRRRPACSAPALPMTAGDTATALLIALGGCMGVNFVSAYVATLLENFGIPQAEGVTAMDATLQSLLLNLVVLALLPALLEEWMFRVCILQTLRRYGDRLALVLSAVLFGVIHGGIAQSVFAFFVGLILGWLAVATGNPRNAVLLHFVNNALSVCLQYATLRLSEPLAMLLNAAVIYGILLVGIITLVICLVRRAPFLKLPPRGDGNTGATVRELWKTPLMVVATLLIVLRMVQFIVYG